jgi:hypothetical protein
MEHDLQSRTRASTAVRHHTQTARAADADASEILGELSAIVFHLNVHTKGWDRLIDGLASQ